MIYKVFLLCLCASLSFGNKGFEFGSKYNEEPLEEIKYAPIPYNFEYNTNDENGTSQFRKESSDGSGKVQGRYGYKDAYGIERIVEYIADENGYRAQIKTNEPGTKNASPAGVELYAQPMSYSFQDLPETKALAKSSLQGPIGAEKPLAYSFQDLPEIKAAPARSSLQGPIGFEKPASQEFNFPTQFFNANTHFLSASKEPQFVSAKKDTPASKEQPSKLKHTFFKSGEEKKATQQPQFNSAFLAPAAPSTTQHNSANSGDQKSSEQAFQFGNVQPQFFVAPQNTFLQPAVPHNAFLQPVQPTGEIQKTSHLQYAQPIVFQASGGPLGHQQSFAFQQRNFASLVPAQQFSQGGLIYTLQGNGIHAPAKSS